jgi:hypothetical protein
MDEKEVQGGKGSRMMPPAALVAKKKNPPTQVITSGLDCFLTST